MLGPTALADYLAGQAYLRTDTVRETGEFAVRAAFDVFPPGQTHQHGLISLVTMLRRSAALIRPPSAASAM